MENLEAEMAKAAGQIAVDTAKDSRKAIGVLLGDAVREWGLTLGDNARFHRFKNLARIMDGVETIARERGYTPDQMRALPFAEAVRVIEAASDEDEEEVQQLWSRLIANATTPDSGVSARKVYVDLLRSLSPTEAVFLDLLLKNSTAQFQTIDDLKAFNERAAKDFEDRWYTFDGADREAAVQNLMRLRCIAVRPQPLDANRLLHRVPQDRSARFSPFEELSYVDARKFEQVLNQLLQQIWIAGGGAEYTPDKGVPLNGGFSMQRWGQPLMIEVPELNYHLTSLGKSLMIACSLEGEIENAEASEGSLDT